MMAELNVVVEYDEVGYITDEDQEEMQMHF
ncbi:DUF2167 domain-containing protein [Chengkuizengella sediminis]|nr:DUF2167 domain-containing protein [Chengkuizengella sediminis]